MQLKNLFFISVLAVVLPLSAAKQETEKKADTTNSKQVTVSVKKQAKVQEVIGKNSNWSRIKDLFM